MKQELIEHIKSQLDDLELDYREGAWEQFRERRDRNRSVIFWRKVMSAAAMLILMLLFIPLQLIKRSQHPKAHQRLASVPAIRPANPAVGSTLEANNVTQLLAQKSASVTYNRGASLIASVMNDEPDATTK